MDSPMRHAALLAGSATVDVTPEGSVPMSGYTARDSPSTGVHDPLKAAALVLADSARIVGIVSVDVLNVSRSFVTAVRRQLADGVSFDELVIAATHTHAGPYVPAPAIDLDSLLAVETDVSETVAGLVDGVVDALERGHDRLAPASLRVGRAEERDVQHNRRAAGGVGGTVRMPRGETNPEVVAALVETEADERAVLYNFACHPVCTTGRETLLSADWPGYTRERVAGTFPGADVLFLNGAAGDINPVGSPEAQSGEAVYEYMSEVGKAVGDAVLRALEAAENGRDRARPPIVTGHTECSLPVKRTPSLYRLQARLDELESGADDRAEQDLRADHHHVNNLLDIAEWGSAHLAASLPYVEVGGVGLIGLPGEAFAEYGRRFKAAAAADTLLPVGYANGYVGYLPPLHELENGGYEVRMAKLSPEALRTVEREALALVS